MATHNQFSPLSRQVMQDVHSLTGGATGTTTQRIFAATEAGVGNRRLLRPTHQALKCPRCDSINTKFCYYNNYNLYQPRHFCKSCKRYWTKGGVLRNVPVGGSCRKSKRSSSSSIKPSPSTSISSVLASSGDNSVIDAAVCPVVPADIQTIFHEFGAPATTAASSLYGIEDISIDPHRADVRVGMLPEIGNFPNLIGCTAEICPIGYGGLRSQHEPHQRDRVFVDGFGPLDWGCSGGDRVEDLFDLTGAVDPSYLSPQDQWTDAGDVVNQSSTPTR